MDDNPLAAWLRGGEDGDGEAVAEAGEWEPAAPAAGGVGGSGAEPELTATGAGAAPGGDTRAISSAAAGGRGIDWGDPPPPGPPRSRWLWLLAAIPWLLVAGLGLSLVRGNGGAPNPTANGSDSDSDSGKVSSLGAAGEHRAGPGGPGVAGVAEKAQEGVRGPQPDAAAGTTQPRLSSDPASAGAALEPTGAGGLPAAPAAADAQRLFAVAELAVRAEVTRLTGARGRWVQDAAAEGLRNVGSVTVVTVRAVVLDSRNGRWNRSRLLRYAVPVTVTANGDVAVSAAPWPLAVTSSAAPRWTPVKDAAVAAAARAGLESVGYRRIRRLRLDRSGSHTGVLRAQLTAAAPGDAEPRHHKVWLADDALALPLGAGTARAEATP